MVAKLLIGHMGKSLDEVYETSILEYEACIEAHNETVHRTWDQTRWLAWVNLCSSPFQKDRPRNPKALLRFPWETGDEVDRAPDVSPEEEQQLMELIRTWRRDREQTS